LILARRPGTDFHRILGKVDFIKGQWPKIPPHIVEFDHLARRPGTDFHRMLGKVDFINRYKPKIS
jgi:hypothetical protein